MIITWLLIGEWAEIQAAYFMVAATGVLIAAIYYIQNMRAAIKIREAQLFMQIFERFREKDFWEGARRQIK